MTFKLDQMTTGIEPIEAEAFKKFRDYWDSLVHPTGSLGELEEVGIKFCAILDQLPEKVDKKAVLVFCNDNGVYEEDISSSPRILTDLLAVQMGENKTGVVALAENAGADVVVVDLGIENFKGSPKVLNRRISNGTKNFMKEDAMTRDQALEAISIGYELASQYIEAGYKVLGTGELGMGNTTTSAAVIRALTGVSEEAVVGLGSGVTDAQLANKLRVVRDCVQVRGTDPADPLGVLAKVGGYDIGAMAGVYLACGQHKVAGVIDGLISSAGALLAYALNENVKYYLFGSHIAKESGAKVALDAMDLKGYFDLAMRLGEGSGCPLLFRLLDDSLYCMNNMVKFDQTDIINTLVNIRDQK
ncbi:MAG: nicotinate-nucleotide--dimethylbenzimidazole phosphoribosyltransferase [Bacillota bacterium]|nr:nicotinate-nucleotide--dimethylbenzimidazole phosphoribosyltransferase [Bacillota bacterium]